MQVRGRDKNCTWIPARDRLKPGGLCRATKRTAGAPFFGGVIVLEGTVHHHPRNLEHQVRPAWCPTHLLLGLHPAVYQPLHRAFGDRRGDWSVSAGPFDPFRRPTLTPALDQKLA
jgi:hypothetical protein